jgi:hypothetical protein
MRGFPKHLNTRADYEYVAGAFPAEKWQPHFQSLLEQRSAWIPAGELKEGEKVVESKSVRVAEVRDEIGRTVLVRVREEFRDDPNAVIVRLGFTVEEVEKALAE